MAEEKEVFKKKEKQPEEKPEGAPGWMVTYGDMMTLVLCFFVLLFSVSTLDKRKLAQVVEAIQVYFHLGRGEPLGKPTISEELKQLKKAAHKEKLISGVMVDNPYGQHALVVRFPKGLQLTVGGNQAFKPNSHVIQKEMARILTKFCKRVRGYRLKVEIKGHASSDLADGKTVKRKWELSRKRAEAVFKFLTTKCGIKNNRLRISYCAHYEPVENLINVSKGSEFNQRVDVILTDEVVVTE